MKIVQYKVIDEGSASELTYSVRSAILEGWQPHGSVNCFACGYSQHYVQAMVKYEP